MSPPTSVVSSGSTRGNGASGQSATQTPTAYVPRSRTERMFGAPYDFSPAPKKPIDTGFQMKPEPEKPGTKIPSTPAPLPATNEVVSGFVGPRWAPIPKVQTDFPQRPPIDECLACLGGNEKSNSGALKRTDAIADYVAATCAQIPERQQH